MTIKMKKIITKVNLTMNKVVDFIIEDKKKNKKIKRIMKFKISTEFHLIIKTTKLMFMKKIQKAS